MLVILWRHLRYDLFHGSVIYLPVRVNELTPQGEVFSERPGAVGCALGAGPFVFCLVVQIWYVERVARL